MMQIPFNSLIFQHDLVKDEMFGAFKKVYESNWFINGEHVSSFENNYSKFNQVKYTIGTSNGFDALFLILKALGIGKGDEVIVPSNTFIATILAVSYVGATPVFAEPKMDTYNINPEDVKKKITKHTKVIMAVNLYGQACNLSELSNIANENNVYLVEDNAQAQGAKFNGILAGSWGIANGVSFYPGKNLGALGDGGAVTTDNLDIATRIEILKNYGSGKKYENTTKGHNMRLDEMQAAFLNVKLKHLERWNIERARLANLYNEGLSHISEIILPIVESGATSVYHLFVVRSKFRDRLREYLSRNGIETLIHYPIPPHLQSCYGDLKCKKGDFPIAEELAETSLSLPLYPGLKEDEVSYVVDTIKKFIENHV